MKRFNTYLTSLDVDFWRNICVREGELRHYKKGEYFCRIGQKNHSVGFIESGIFKYVVVNSEGEDQVTGFVFESSPVGDYLSLALGSKTRTDIIALANADVFVCDGSIVSDLLRQDPVLNANVAIQLLMQTYDRFLDLYRKSPKERYVDLLANSPEILQQVPLKELASYLQITPTYLSRIRREITFQE